MVPGEQPSQLFGRLDQLPQGYIPLRIIREAIVDADRLGAAVAAAERVEADCVRSIVGLVPREMLSEQDASMYVEFLLQRQARLRAVFNEGLGWFTNLRGSAA